MTIKIVTVAACALMAGATPPPESADFDSVMDTVLADQDLREGFLKYVGGASRPGPDA